ncbi:hypothetical protein OE88DRAFT_1726802 [Heliocybe sulcata]|uniref:Zn(2)-C6 fungal-type domain-containing protein n=1 Tax=Heliocybe sulcata TaxID=5364 RepID=A0A5C3MXE9_9AGAM|nr:hypothetical protein OE88DRAFT_1726802 [Heliocybe sulcata]
MGYPTKMYDTRPANSMIVCSIVRPTSESRTGRNLPSFRGQDSAVADAGARLLFSVILYHEERFLQDGADSSKKKRVLRACDICRRRKIRCDGPQSPESRCSNCAALGLDCTYKQASLKRTPPKGYIRSLEERLQKMEKLLENLAPGIDLADLSTLSDGDTGYRELNATPLGVTPSTAVLRTTQGVEASDLDPSDDEYVPQGTLTEHARRLYTNPLMPRFFGKSSGFMLIRNALDLKRKYSGEDPTTMFEKKGFINKRPEFWTVYPWEDQKPAEIIPEYQFPPVDLIDSLVNLYLEHQNTFYPLFHEPTLRKDVASALHLRDHSFACVLLLICACGSRWSDDHRVIVDGSDTFRSAGWQWFNQVQMVRKPYTVPPSLYELQHYALTAMFLQGSSSPQACWTILGIGLRAAQEVGAHRAKVYYNSRSTKDDELWKRAFWVLVTLDRVYSSVLGRPCAIQEEDFDLDTPVECDDEFWDPPEPDKAFRQPPDRPSKIAAFNCYLKLNQLLAVALRTIYCINKSKVLLGFVGKEWEQRIVAELDSEMNKWFDSVPTHLRWNANQEDSLFFRQSVMLYCSYYNLQILIHRPFIMKSRKLSPLSNPSLAICVNAARSLAHTADACRTVCKKALAPLVIMGVFPAALVLILDIFNRKQSSTTESDAADIGKCILILKSMEGRWHAVGRIVDILCRIAAAGHIPPLFEYWEQRCNNPSDAGRRSNGQVPTGPSLAQESGVPVFSQLPGFSQASSQTTGTTSLFNALSYGRSLFANPEQTPQMAHESGYAGVDLSQAAQGPYTVPAEFASPTSSVQMPENRPTASEAGSGPSFQSPQMIMDEDVMGLWSEMTDWESYITNVLGTDHFPSGSGSYLQSDGTQYTSS